MNNTAFTQEQAEEIAEDFEDLADTGFQKDGQKWTISQISVCNSETAEKSIFPQKRVDDSMLTATKPDADATGFDVTLLLMTDDQIPSYSSIDIRTYAAMMGISYKFPV